VGVWRELTKKGTNGKRKRLKCSKVGGQRGIEGSSALQKERTARG